MTSLSITTIDSSLKSQLATTGKIVLDASVFDGQDSIKLLLDEYFFASKGQITIESVSGYNFDSTAGEITFAGKGVGGPLDGMTIDQVLIKVDTSDTENPLHLSIDAIPPNEWKLDKSFPALTSESIEAIGFSETTVKTGPQSPRLFWASYQDDAAGVTQGFYFQGIMDLVAPYDFLDMFLGANSKNWLSGSITMFGATNKDTGYADYQPVASLKADVSDKPVSLGPFKLVDVQVGMNMSPAYNEIAMAFQTHSSLSVNSTLMFMDAAIGLEVKIEEPDQPILFTANLANAFHTGMEDLSKLVFGDSSSKKLGVPGFSLADPNAITLEDISFSYTPTGPGKGLNSITVDMGTPKDQEWVIWDDVKLKNIVVTFMVMPGKKGGKTAFSGSFAGIVEDWLSINASFDHTDSGNDFTFYGGLAKPVKIAQIVEFFAGKPIKELPDLEVSRLDVAISKSTNKTFGFAGEILMDGEWILHQRPDISLRGLLFQLSRTPGDGASSTNAVKAGGMLDIGDYQFSVEADYTTDSGWKFTGDMMFIGTKEKTTNFGKALNTHFSTNTEMPGMIVDWYIKNIHVEFDTKPGNFTFTCTLGNSDYPTLELEFDFILTKETGEYKMEFDGILTYSTDTFDIKFEVDVIVEKIAEPPSKTTTFIAKYDSQKPPTLVEFLEAISKDLGFEADLPQELKFDADLESLTLEIIKKDKEPIKVDAAGLFQLEIEGSKWDLYLAFSNDAHFESAGPDSRANGASGKPAYVFGISFSGILDLEKLPLVGKIPGIGNYNIDKLGFYYTNAVFSGTEKKLIFAVAELDTQNTLATDPAAAFLNQPKFSLMALLGDQKGDKAKPNAMPLGTGTGTPNGTGVPPVFARKKADPRKPLKWLPVNKTLGPVDIEKIGLGYEKPGKDDAGELGIVGIYVTGAFTIAGLTMVLDRLGISFPVPKPGSTIKDPLSEIGFHLGGMFLEYKEPGFEIAGGFVNLPGGSVNMIGEFVVEVGEFGLQAYGGYSNQLGHPSMFIFLHLNAPLGGPPFFFIDGVSGGFGINRGFKLPTYEELGNYPLLPASASIPTAGSLSGKSNSDKLDAMTQSLLSLAEYFPVENGEYWFAVGLDVTSFEMIDVSAILAIAFGVELEIAVIGSASMTLPVKEPEPIAYIQINFEVSYSSSSGLLAVMGAITPASFLYANLVHISGGFAFYTWFSGPHSGDFVLTIGGYNSHYKRPKFYPNVPRMELRAGIGIVNMVGDAYFALVPHMIMGGLDFKATADLGPISAWFDAGVDFLFGWKPFHYEAEAHIDLGASFTADLGFVKIKITIHVGVGLDIWGPDFGGKARVDLAIISFTINFGAKPKPAPPLKWDEFKEFLPSVSAPPPNGAGNHTEAMLFADNSTPEKEKSFVNIVVKEGLIKSFTEAQGAEGLNWIVDANHFDIRTHSTAPCASFTYNGMALLDNYKYFEPGNLRKQIESSQQQAPYYVYKTPDGETSWHKLKFGIPPMHLTNIKSVHQVTFKKLGEKIENVQDVIITLGTDGVPPSLWGNEPVKQSSVTSDKTVIKNALVQLQFTPTFFFPKRTTFIAYYYLVFDTNNILREQATEPQINAAKFTDPPPATIYAEMDQGTAFSDTAEVRSKITTTLEGLGFDELRLINSGDLRTRNYVARKPILTYMSSTSETKFS